MNKRIRKKEQKLLEKAIEKIENDCPAAIVEGYIDKTRNKKWGRAIRRALSAGTLVIGWHSWEFWRGPKSKMGHIGNPSYVIPLLGKLYKDVHSFGDAVDGQIDFNLRKFIASQEYEAQIRNTPEFELVENVLVEILNKL